MAKSPKSRKAAPVAANAPRAKAVRTTALRVGGAVAVLGLGFALYLLNLRQDRIAHHEAHPFARRCVTPQSRSATTSPRCSPHPCWCCLGCCWFVLRMARRSTAPDGAAYGVSLYRFQILRRLEKSRVLLLNGHTLADVALSNGFADQAHWSWQFKSAYGFSPGQWRGLLDRT